MYSANNILYHLLVIKELQKYLKDNEDRGIAFSDIKRQLLRYLLRRRNVFPNNMEDILIEKMILKAMSNCLIQKLIKNQR